MNSPQPTPPDAANPPPTPATPAAPAKTRWRWPQWLESQKTTLEVVQSAVTIVALVAGGFWFVAQGSWRASRLAMEQSITHVPLNASNNLLLVRVKLKNEGSVAIRLTKMHSRIQVLEPAERMVLDALDAGTSPPIAGATGDWPIAAQRIVSTERTIEPGGQDTVEFSYFIPQVVGSIRSEVYFGREGQPAWTDIDLYAFATGRLGLKKEEGK